MMKLPAWSPIPHDIVEKADEQRRRIERAIEMLKRDDDEFDRALRRNKPQKRA